MERLSKQMQRIVRDYNAGAVATVNADGTPAVSPKATFVVIDERCIAYGNIRSPGTSANLGERPAVEVNFIDVLARLALRVRGTGRVIQADAAEADSLRPRFEAQWGPYLQYMSEFICIDVTAAQLITSPAYDLGVTRAELQQSNLAKLTALVDRPEDSP